MDTLAIELSLRETLPAAARGDHAAFGVGAHAHAPQDGPHEGAHDRHHARELHLLRHRLRAGAGRFAAHVHQVGAVGARLAGGVE